MLTEVQPDDTRQLDWRVAAALSKLTAHPPGSNNALIVTAGGLERLFAFPEEEARRPGEAGGQPARGSVPFASCMLFVRRVWDLESDSAPPHVCIDCTWGWGGRIDAGWAEVTITRNPAGTLVVDLDAVRVAPEHRFRTHEGGGVAQWLLGRLTRLARALSRPDAVAYVELEALTASGVYGLGDTIGAYVWARAGVSFLSEWGPSALKSTLIPRLLGRSHELGPAVDAAALRQMTDAILRCSEPADFARLSHPLAHHAVHGTKFGKWLLATSEMKTSWLGRLVVPPTEPPALGLAAGAEA